MTHLSALLRNRLLPETGRMAQSLKGLFPPIWTRPDKFRLVMTFFQREDTYSLALASLSAYAKREIRDLEVSLVAVTGGDDIGEYVQKVRAQQPHLIAVSSMHPTWLPYLPFLDALHAALPGTPVVVGGYQAIFSPEETLAHPAVDYICVGDGEIPLVKLIQWLGQSDGSEPETPPLPGLWSTTVEGEIVRSQPVLTENLEQMPFLDYTIFERTGDLSWLSPHAVESKDLVTLPIMSGRGCPYRCSYCSNTSLLELYRGKGSFLRKYDAQELIDEMCRLRDYYGIQYFQFMDETFSFDRKYAYQLLDLYAQRLGLPFSFFARIEQLDEKFCRAAAAAGCHALWFGVESGSEEYRRRYLGRRMTNAQILEAAEAVRRCGIKRMTFNMIGMPFETRENVLETLELTQRIQPELALFSQFLPLPGTPLYELSREAGLLLEPCANQQMWSLGSLNIKEQHAGISAGEFQELTQQIMHYVIEQNKYD